MPLLKVDPKLPGPALPDPLGIVPVGLSVRMPAAIPAPPLALRVCKSCRLSSRYEMFLCASRIFDSACRITSWLGVALRRA